MLQQTQVTTVLEYYRRFLERFGSLEALAGAPTDDVLAAWSGLGYYRRARWLQAAAREIVTLGRFPRQASELRALPGVGAYTSAAIASIAFGEPVAAVDGNGERVLARVLAYGEDPRSKAGRSRLLAKAAALLDPQRPGDSNQALIELGATLCRPRRPACGECPLRGGCRAADEGRPEAFPKRPKRRRPVRQRRLMAVVEEAGRVLLFRRPEDSELWPGMWELPWAGIGAATREAGAAALGERYGGTWKLGSGVYRFRHSVTYRRLEVVVRRGWVSGSGVREGKEAGWFDPRGRAGLALPSLVSKALRGAEESAAG